MFVSIRREGRTDTYLESNYNTLNIHSDYPDNEMKLFNFFLYLLAMLNHIDATNQKQNNKINEREDLMQLLNDYITLLEESEVDYTLDQLNIQSKELPSTHLEERLVLKWHDYPSYLKHAITYMKKYELKPGNVIASTSKNAKSMYYLNSDLFLQHIPSKTVFDSYNFDESKIKLIGDIGRNVFEIEQGNAIDVSNPFHVSLVYEPTLIPDKPNRSLSFQHKFGFGTLSGVSMWIWLWEVSLGSCLLFFISIFICSIIVYF